MDSSFFAQGVMQHNAIIVHILILRFETHFALGTRPFVSCHHKSQRFFVINAEKELLGLAYNFLVSTRLFV